ncbi:MAG: F0F1 ATP synthase subunit gamma [Lachnospiraceae bacterium]|nr:F0F1 ATP synthase subunit gamma [Lachnospiraceae bacterium]
MNVKNVVKVMNFHALVRVDSARRRATKLMMMDRQLYEMMDQILNNRNFRLDKRLPVPPQGKPKLVIYVGSDYGFCSNYNNQVSELLLMDRQCEKIIIGKKLRKTESNVLLRIDHAEFADSRERIQGLLEKAVCEGANSEVYIVYNRYINSAKIEFQCEKLYPIDIPENADRSVYKDDFVVEGDLSRLLMDILITYLMQELELAIISGYASENIMRQDTTHESLKKIEEREEEQLMWERKQRRQEEFGKLVENFIQSSSYGR